MLDATAEQLRNLLVSQAADALTDLENYRANDPDPEVQKDIANARGRYEAARDAVVAFLSTLGQVAEFQAANVADAIIASAKNNS